MDIQYGEYNDIVILKWLEYYLHSNTSITPAEYEYYLPLINLCLDIAGNDDVFKDKNTIYAFCAQIIIKLHSVLYEKIMEFQKNTEYQDVYMINMIEDHINLFHNMRTIDIESYIIISERIDNVILEKEMPDMVKELIYDFL